MWCGVYSVWLLNAKKTLLSHHQTPRGHFTHALWQMLANRQHCRTEPTPSNRFWDSRHNGYAVNLYNAWRKNKYNIAITSMPQIYLFCAQLRMSKIKRRLKMIATACRRRKSFRAAFGHSQSVANEGFSRDSASCCSFINWYRPFPLYAAMLTQHWTQTQVHHAPVMCNKPTLRMATSDPWACRENRLELAMPSPEPRSI